MIARWWMCSASSLRLWRFPYLLLFIRDGDSETFTYALDGDVLYGHVDDEIAGRSSLCSGAVVCSRSGAALILPLGLISGGFRSLGNLCGVVAPVFSSLQPPCSIDMGCLSDLCSS